MTAGTLFKADLVEAEKEFESLERGRERVEAAAPRGKGKFSCSHLLFPYHTFSKDWRQKPVRIFMLFRNPYTMCSTVWHKIDLDKSVKRMMSAIQFIASRLSLSHAGPPRRAPAPSPPVSHSASVSQRTAGKGLMSPRWR